MELNNITGFLIHRTDVKMTNFFTKQLKQYEITPEQWGILCVLDLSVFLWGVSFGGAPTLFQTAANKVAGKAIDVATSIIVTVYNMGIFGGSLAGGFILTASSAYALPWTVFVLILIALTFIWNGHRNAFPRTISNTNVG